MLADLQDPVFGGWDIYEESAHEAAANAKELDPSLLQQARDPLEACPLDYRRQLPHQRFQTTASFSLRAWQANECVLSPGTRQTRICGLEQTCDKF